MKTVGLGFFLLAHFHLITTHPLCRDTTGPQGTTNTFCTDYSGNTCCSVAADAQKQTLYNQLSISDSTCADFMKGILCSECDAYAAHLYGDEYQTPSKVPSLCHGFCDRFYSACSQVQMNWPSGSIFGSNPISATYDTASAFCSKFYSSVAPDYCYNGTVFQPIPPPPAAEGTPQLCLEHFMPNGIAEEEQMLYLADPHDNSGRIFALYKRGDIIARNRTNGAEIGLFLTVPGVVCNGELGLLSMAFHPEYATNRKFYIYYITDSMPAACVDDEVCGGSTCTNGTCDGEWTTIVAEYLADQKNASMADPDSARILIVFNQPYANHKGGHLHFGADGYLYIPTGDGGSGNDPWNNSQNLNRYHGKMLRIDVDHQSNNLPYGIPSDNPFVNGNRPEIWAYGLRNPWRCSFDKERPTYHACGDVGQDEYEEVDLITKGGNFGWRRYEGNHDNNVNIDDPEYPFIRPVIEYNHSDPTLGSGPSVIGGYFYRGNKDVCNYGRYIFCDWTGPLKSAQETFEGSGEFITSALSYMCATDSVGCAGIGNILSFSEDDNGDLYILGHEGVMRLTNTDRCPGLVTCNALSTSTSSSTSSSIKSSSTSSTTSSGSNNGSGSSGAVGSSSASLQSHETLVQEASASMMFACILVSVVLLFLL